MINTFVFYDDFKFRKGIILRTQMQLQQFGQQGVDFSPRQFLNAAFQMNYVLQARGFIL